MTENSYENLLNNLRQKGYSENEVSLFENKFTDKLLKQGYTSDEINKSLGRYKLEDLANDPEVMKPIDNYFERILPGFVRDARKIKRWAVSDESNIYNFFRAGFGESATNYMLQYHTDGKLGYDWRQSFKELGDEGVVESLARQVGTIVGDIPIAAPVGIATLAATKKPTAAGFASGFATEAIRKTYLESLKSGKIKDFPQWWSLFVKKGVYEGLKGGAIFGATVAGPAALTALKLPKNVLTTLTGSYLGMQSAGIAINSAEQKKLTLPSSKQLQTDALLIYGLGGLGYSSLKLGNMVLNRQSKTGESTADITSDIFKDRQTMQEAASENIRQFSQDLTPENQIQVNTLKSQLDVLKKISEGKEPIGKEELLKRKETLKEELGIGKTDEPVEITIENIDKIDNSTQELKFINDQIKEIDHREKQKKINEPDVLSERQLEIEKDLKELGVPVEQSTTKITYKKEPKKREEIDDLGDELFEESTNEVPKRASDEKITGFTKFLYNVVDTGRPVKAIEDALVKKGATRRYVYEALTNLSSVNTKARSWVDGAGSFNMLTDKIDGMSLKKAFSGLEKIDNGLQRFSTYKTMKRVAEKEKQDIDLNIPVDTAKKIVRTYSSVYETYSKRYDQIQDKLRQAMEDSGLVSQKLMTKIKELNKDFFPMQKIYSAEFKGNKKVASGFRLQEMKGLKPLKDKIKKVEEQIEKAKKEPATAVLIDAKKTEKIKKLEEKKESLQQELNEKTKISDPIEVAATDIVRIISIAQRNMVKKSFFDTYFDFKKKNPNDTTFDWIKVVKRTPKEIKIKKEELEKFMPDEFVENLADADVNAFSIFRGERHDLKPTEVDYLDKGKRIIMDVGDEFLAQSINRDQAFNKLYKQLNDNIFMKAAVGISQVKRLGIVLDPVFTFTTGMAQEIFLPLVTKTNYYPFIDLTRGILMQIPGITKKSRERAKRITEDFEKNISRAAFTEGDRQAFSTPGLKKELEKRRFINEILPEDPVSPYIYPFIVTKNLTKKITVTSFQTIKKAAIYPTQLFERAPRVVLKERMRKQLLKENQEFERKGMQYKKYSERDIETLSNFEARDFQDFARGGARMESWSRINVFLRAGIEGVYKLFNVATDAKMLSKALRLGFTGLTMPTILLWFANKDSETYKNVSPFIKSNFWIFVTDEEKGLYLKIRRPWELGWIFATLPERILEKLYYGDKEIANKMDRHYGVDFFKYLSNFVPFVPDFIVPVIEDGFNRNLYTERKITPTRFNYEIGEFEETRNTSEIAKLTGSLIRQLGNIIGFEGRDYGSPYKIDHYIRGYLGPLGQKAIKSLDGIILKAKGDPTKYVKPWSEDTATNITRLPVVQYFFQRKGLSSEVISKYWENYQKIAPYRGVVNRLIEQKKFDEAKEILSDWQFRLVKQSTKMHKAMNKMYEFHNKLNAIEMTKNSVFTPEQVANLIDANINNIIRLAEAQNKLVLSQKKRIENDDKIKRLEKQLKNK